jgi:hypothetical protein
MIRVCLVVYICILSSVAALLSGCDDLWLDTYWRSGKYVLMAVDTPGQMFLGIDQGNGAAVGIVGPTVFSVGADDRYIVVKQHPATDLFGRFDRSVTNYFIVDRAVVPDGALRGPLNAGEFAALSASMALPAFTKTFDDLAATSGEPARRN